MWFWGQPSLYNAHLKFHGGVACGWLLRVARWERGELVGEEHMVFFWGLVRFPTGSNFPTRSVVDTEDSNSSSGWPSLPQLIRMPLTGTLGWGKSGTMSKVRGYRWCVWDTNNLHCWIYIPTIKMPILEKTAVSGPRSLLCMRNLIKWNS